MEQKQLSKEKACRGRIGEGDPNPVDRHVGQRIRLRRTLLGYTQQEVASKLGLTSQQLQKYEKGQNRVGASRLWDISRVLNVSMDFFFQDMSDDIESQSPRMLALQPQEMPFLKEEQSKIDTDPMLRQETLELVRAYYKISNRKVAKEFFNLLVMLAKTDHPEYDED